MPSPNNPPRDPRHIARLLAAMVPDEVKKAISSAEYNDRLVEAARLSADSGVSVLLLVRLGGSALPGDLGGTVVLWLLTAPWGCWSASYLVHRARD